MNDAYRDVTAEQRIADLKVALVKAQDEVACLKQQVTCLKRQRLQKVLEYVANPFWWMLLFVAVVGSVITFEVAASDGKIDYCYVDTPNNERRTLYGHRPWRMDASLKSLPSKEDPAPLFALAKEIECPIR